MMMFTLSDVVPWGRSFDEYRRMFMLSEEDLQTTILGCADGPASFNAEATGRGVKVISCDPLYRLTKAQIEERIAATYDEVLDQTRRNAENFVWETIRSVEELGRVRMESMRRFLDDYETGRAERRYIAAELPVLPFDDSSAGLALCSNFLFLYADRFDQSFHVAAVRELCRVAREVRIFPLLDLSGSRSPHVEPVIDALQASDYSV
jgi:hypothetical protein